MISLRFCWFIFVFRENENYAIMNTIDHANPYYCSVWRDVVRIQVTMGVLLQHYTAMTPHPLFQHILGSGFLFSKTIIMLKCLAKRYPILRSFLMQMDAQDIPLPS